MEEIDIKEMLAYFQSRILWILISIFAIIIVGNIYTIATRVPMYKSNTTIVLVNNKTEAYNTNELQLNKNLVGTYTEIIKSRKILEEVIKNLGLNYNSNSLSKNISVSAVTDTEIIRITVSDKNPKLAKKIANEIADVFAKEIQKIYKLNNVSIVDKAEESTSPYNISVLKDNIIFILIGIMLSCGIIFVKFYFDTSIKSTEEIENKLGLTVIGIVPKVEKE